MTGAWGLPMQAELGGVRYAIRSDYRDVLELLRWLNGQADPALDQSERWYVAMRLFYPEFAALPQPLWSDATQFLTEFLAAGRREQPRPGPALMDWQQDAPLIAAGISKAAGQDVRTLPYLHWWSFLAWFDAIGEGSFATVVAIRDKLRRGKRLENWELDYYRTHRAVVELRGVESAEEQAEKAAAGAAGRTRLTCRECALYGKQPLVGSMRAGRARPLQGNGYSGEEVRIHDGIDF